MERCVSRIREDAFSAITWWEEMQTKVPAHILAVGNIRLSRKQDPENIIRYLKMKEELIFLIPKTSA